MKPYDDPARDLDPPFGFTDEGLFQDAPDSRPQSVVACSVCLRVLRGDAWIEAEAAIRELRSFERPTALPLEPGFCAECSDRARARRDAEPQRPTGARRSTRSRRRHAQLATGHGSPR
jgi:hypothetical protein